MPVNEIGFFDAIGVIVKCTLFSLVLISLQVILHVLVLFHSMENTVFDFRGEVKELVEDGATYFSLRFDVSITFMPRASRGPVGLLQQNPPSRKPLARHQETSSGFRRTPGASGRKALPEL